MISFHTMVLYPLITDRERTVNMQNWLIMSCQDINDPRSVFRFNPQQGHQPWRCPTVARYSPRPARRASSSSCWRDGRGPSTSSSGTTFSSTLSSTMYSAASTDSPSGRKVRKWKTFSRKLQEGPISKADTSKNWEFSAHWLMLFICPCVVNDSSWDSETSKESISEDRTSFEKGFFFRSNHMDDLITQASSLFRIFTEFCSCWRTWDFRCAKIPASFHNAKKSVEGNGCCFVLNTIFNFMA